MGWLDHRELRIVRGVYIAPGDSNSVEPAIVELNLLSNATGIALTADGWTPNIPALKNGGVWADSPISDGRTLISGVNGNVTETMRLVITGGTYKEAAGYLAALNNMIRDCRDFWQANAQIDPVYIQWYASCGTGRQYALIYNMDFDAEYKDSPTPQIEGTLTIERECYWRAIPPGANPRQWYSEINNQPYNVAAGLVTNLPTTYSATIQNKSEFSVSGSTYTSLSNNEVVIPASAIPGDAPALLMMISNSSKQLVAGNKTKKITQYSSASPPNITLPQNYVFNAADGTLGTDATRVADTGASIRTTTGAATRVEISFATATNQLRWNMPSFQANINRYIGRFMVFMRCRQQGGSVGDITMYLRNAATVAADTDGVKLNVVSPPVIAGAGNSTNWGLVYMGVIQSPLVTGKANVNVGGNANIGNGLQPTNTFTFDLGLYALRSAGVAPLYINDVILIPIDEGSITIEKSGTFSGVAYYDNTGYFTHGTPEEFAMLNAPGSAGTQYAKLTGDGINLVPNVENRISILLYSSDTLFSLVTDTAFIWILIVPRCTGIRGF